MEQFLNKNDFNIFECSVCLLKKTDLKKNYEVFLKEYYDQGYYTGSTKRVAYVSYKEDRKYIEKNIKKYDDHGIFRKSWATWKTAMGKTEQKKLVNKLVAEDADFENVILPLRDGIHLVRKK
jgi:hypothetical protein